MADGAADNLDDLIRRADPDRWLASRFSGDPAARADVIAIYAFDHELARARRVGSTSLMAEIRLTWWREALDDIFAGGPVRRHPGALALADAVRRHGLPRELLEAMIDGQVEALDADPTDEAAALAWADAVQGSAARLAARVLDAAADDRLAAPAGRAWGLALLIRGQAGSPDDLREALRRALAEAARAKLSPAATPAALPARLARFDLAGRKPGPLAKRLALIAATATGRV